MIEINGVSKRYRSRPAVTNLSLEIGRGERIAILGPSGCGKTTLLRLIAGFIAPDAGTIIIDGKVVAAEGRNVVEPERRNIGMVFQDLALWPHLTVGGNLEFGLKAKGIAPKEREERMREILKLVHMEQFVHVRPTELSGGQQQRVALARALVLRPDVLLMDEPLSSLDVELSLMLRKEVLRLHREIGFTLVYVTHNLDEAFDIGAQIVVIKNRTVSCKGSVAEIRTHLKSLVAPLHEKPSAL
jgi:ABC-type Fe3+/spermidine/putrescine transport system ATPase subunit